MAIVLLAAGGLAYYGYSFSTALSNRERLVILDTLRELAAEKLIGIESEIDQIDRATVDRIDLENLIDFKWISLEGGLAAQTVLVLDERLEIVPGGFFTKRRQRAEIDHFRRLFLSRMLRDLRLESAPFDEIRHLHRVYEERPYLLTYIRRYARGRTYYVVIEADLSYLVGVVFPEFFDSSSPRLFQIVNEADQVVYGYAFTGVPGTEVVELGFDHTLTLWKLRIAQRESGSAQSTRKAVDLVLIGSALAVIVAGMSVLVIAMRQERRANQLKSDFISNVSHELKTPLSIISMFGEMLAMGRVKSPEQATEYAEIIRRESVRLSRLIDNVLDFAKIERGADVYEFTDGDLREVLDRALDLARHRLERAGMTLETEIDGELPPVHLDANALTLAVLNLVDNAIKYAADGKRLRIILRRVGERALLEVRDFGPGVEEDEQAHIFERFYRARSVRLKPIRGSGIGLSLVKHVIEAHGGEIELDSTPGQGSAFRMWIPLHQVVRV
jgi:two-component system phosphate regulon sensor histidine kinase PhoR